MNEFNSLLYLLINPSYERARRLRVAIIHGLARMAALMASTYKAYLGVGLGPLSVGPVARGIYWLRME